MLVEKKCPHCGKTIKQFHNPVLTVDVIIELNTESNKKSIVLIDRKNYPFGWALPGGFVDYGETVENAAVREALEETSLHVKLNNLLGIYSDPDRDPRKHIISIVFVAKAEGMPIARDDAAQVAVFAVDKLPERLAFDHSKILADYLEYTSG